MRFSKFMRAFVLALSVIILSTSVADAAATLYVYPNGSSGGFTVPASQYLNVFAGPGAGSCKVFKQVGGPSTNMVARFVLETSGQVTNGETVFGPYTNATTLRIDAGPDKVYYSIGAAINSLSNPVPVLQAMARPAYSQATPIAYTTTQTLAPTDLMTGIITATHAAGATQAYTLPTGTFMDTACGLQSNQGFEWTLINLSGTPATNTVTLTAGTGHTIVGEAIVGTATIGTNSSRWFTRKTAANTFVTYRLH